MRVITPAGFCESRKLHFADFFLTWERALRRFCMGHRAPCTKWDSMHRIEEKPRSKND